MSTEPTAKEKSAESRLSVAIFVWLFFGIIAMYFVIFLFGRDRFWLGIVLAAFIGFSSILAARRISWRIDEKKALAMRSTARSDNRPPFLVLRSFSRDGLAFRPDNYTSTTIAQGKSYMNDIAEELQDIGRTLANGTPDDTIEMSEKRLLYFQSSENGWVEMFRLASEVARAVIVIPGNTPGMLREMSELTSSGAISKVIVFMPPTPSGFAATWIVQYGRPQDIARSWRKAQSEWRNLGVSLPDYDRSGMVFALDSSGKPHQEINLGGDLDDLDLAPIRELTKAPRGSYAPISVLIPELECLEAPRKRPGLLIEVLRLIGLGY